MNDQPQSIFLLFLFKGAEYIGDPFLMDRINLFRTIQSLKVNQLKFVQRIKQMMIQDSIKLSTSELSDKYGIPLRAISDIIKDQEIRTSQMENSYLKLQIQQIQENYEKETPKNQSVSFLNEQTAINDQDTKHLINLDNQSMKDSSHNQQKVESDEASQKTKEKLNEFDRNILTISQKPEISNNEKQEQGKLLSFNCITFNNQKTPQDKNQNSQKKKKIKVESRNQINRIQQSFDKNHNGDYICKQCQKIYTQQHLSTLKNKQVLYNHFYNKHAQKFKCFQCNLIFKKLKILDHHFIKAHCKQ